MKQLTTILIFIVISSCGDNSNNPSENQDLIEGKVLEYDIDNEGGWILTSDSETIKVDRNIDPNKAFFTKCFGKGLGNYNFTEYQKIKFNRIPILAYTHLTGRDFEIKRTYKKGYIETQENLGLFYHYVPSKERYIRNNGKIIKKINENPNITYNFTYNKSNYVDTVWRVASDFKSLFKVFEHDSDGRIKYEIDEVGNKRIYKYDNTGMISKIFHEDTSVSSGNTSILVTETFFKIENGRIVELGYWNYDKIDREVIGDNIKYKISYNETGDVSQYISYTYINGKFIPRFKTEYIYE